jgi:hypothetical protein
MVSLAGGVSVLSDQGVSKGGALVYQIPCNHHGASLHGFSVTSSIVSAI